MMKYEVIHPFRDLEDKKKSFPDGREYTVGDEFPATKRDVAEERLEELKESKNKIGRPLIRDVEEEQDKDEQE